MVRFFRMGVLMVILTAGMLLTGCELLDTGGGKDQAITFPSATTISYRAKEIGMPSQKYVERMYNVKESSLQKRYGDLIASAPDNQKRKYELLLSQDLEFLEYNYQERKRQLLAWES